MHYTDLNYDNYDEYLAGEEWKEIRDFIYQIAVIPYYCRICHVPRDLLLHKRSYIFLHPKKLKLLQHKYLKKIFVWICHPCNEKVHFYAKNERVPLDYIFLWEREQKVYRMPRFIFLRFVRTLKRFSRWMYWSYRLSGRRKNRY